MSGMRKLLDSPEKRLRKAKYEPPKNGPFRCGRCTFFEHNNDFCDHEEVLTNVEPMGCCEYFHGPDSPSPSYFKV
jgi:hypothetical protein